VANHEVVKARQGGEGWMTFADHWHVLIFPHVGSAAEPAVAGSLICPISPLIEWPRTAFQLGFTAG
jgi:hypothetical protein